MSKNGEHVAQLFSDEYLASLDGRYLWEAAIYLDGKIVSQVEDLSERSSLGVVAPVAVTADARLDGTVVLFLLERLVEAVKNGVVELPRGDHLIPF